MTRIDRERFAAANFPVRFEIATRIDDVDMQAHVNNAASVVLLQEARANFNMAANLGALAAGLRPMVAAIHVEYAGEIHHPAIVVIDSGVLSIGRTSFMLGQVARVDGRPRLYAQAVMVLGDANGAAPIPDGLRAVYEKLIVPDL